MSRESAGNRWTVILGGLVVQIILGTVYAFSVFVKPLEAQMGWDRATTQWAFSVTLATFAIVMIPAGRLQDRIGPRKVASIGGVLLGISFLAGALSGSTRTPLGAVSDLRGHRRCRNRVRLCLSHRRSSQVVP